MTQPDIQGPKVKGFFSNPILILFAGIFLLSAVLLAVGLSAAPSLGDEVHHYRFAKNCFSINGRALYDSIYASAEAPGFFYNTEALWPLALSWIWRLLGRISFPIAQIYHIFYYALLLLGTFQVARKSYGIGEGLLSTLLVATCPMVVSFGILFYLDVPAAAFSVWIFYFLQERRYWGASILMGTGYLIRKSTGFFVPVIFLWIVLRSWKHWGELLRDNIKTFLPAKLIILTDETWRNKHLLVHQVISSKGWIVERIAALRSTTLQINLQLPEKVKPAVQEIGPLIEKVRPSFLAKAGAVMADFSNSSIGNPADAVKYFGIPLILGICLYVFFRRGDKRDRSLWAFCLFFTGCAGILHLFPDIRYALPIAPFLAILAARGWFETFKRQGAKYLVGILCMLQFFAAALYTRQERMLPKGIKEGFSYMREQLPKDALILYPETNLLEYAERRMIWTRMNVRTFFWGSDKERAEQLLDVKLNYIAIKKNRVYDDTQTAALHVGKYPLSFVNSLKALPYLTKIFENDAMSLWKINSGSGRSD